MEEDILRLIQWSLQQPHNEEICEDIAAKEITSHVFKFIEWMSEQEDFFKLNGREWYSKKSKTWKEYSIEDIYLYWKDNME